MELWRIITEICVEPGDFPSGDTLGYINIITWARSSEEALEKLSGYFKTFNWHVLEVDSVCRVVDLIECSDVLEEMIDRAQNTPMPLSSEPSTATEPTDSLAARRISPLHSR